MSEVINIMMPQENVSDDFYTVIEVLFNDGEKVKAGDGIIVCEGSKTAFEIEAESDGFIFYKKSLGDEVEVGEVVAEISHEGHDIIDESSSKEVKLDINISKKATELAKKHNIDLSIFANKTMVSTKDIQKVINKKNNLESNDLFKKNDVAIVGAGGHSKQIYDSIKDKRNIVGLIVASLSEEPYDDLDIIGTLDDFEALRERNLNKIIIGFGSLDNPKKRQILADELRSLGFKLDNVIHPTAIIEPSAIIKDGVQIFAGAIVGSRARISDNSIINSGAIVSHDSFIKKNVHITPGAILGGGVEIGENTIVGMGCSIYLGVKIGQNKVLKNGLHIFKDMVTDN